MRKLKLPVISSSSAVSSVLLLLLLPLLSHADVGTAASYPPPYLPTACYGTDPNQFPAGNLFAVAGEGIWDNGASCGRQYLVRCLSAATPGACTTTAGGAQTTIQVTVVDRASSLFSKPSRSGTTMVLSVAAFGMIAASSTADQINIEFRQT